MNKEMFLKNLDELNINYTEKMLENLEDYYNLIVEYNKHTNLTRIIEKEEAYLKHFYDSLTIAKIIDLNNEKNLLDIGSGAGLPGIVLKIFYPHLEITLLDSNNKKTKFLEYVSEKLGLNITVINDRAENFVKNKINSFDVVTARAVANLRVLTELSVPFAKLNGYFIAMKANATEEINESKETIKVLNLEVEKIINFKLPKEAGERTLIKMCKKETSVYKNLRSYDKILKNSLKKNLR